MDIMLNPFRLATPLSFKEEPGDYVNNNCHLLDLALVSFHYIS
jgi:hypothetical protein